MGIIDGIFKKVDFVFLGRVRDEERQRQMSSIERDG